MSKPDVNIFPHLGHLAHLARRGQCRVRCEIDRFPDQRDPESSAAAAAVVVVVVVVVRDGCVNDARAGDQRALHQQGAGRGQGRDCCA